MTADPHPFENPDHQAGSTGNALDGLITATGSRPVRSVEDLDRFRTELWDSDAELEAFLVDVRASRNAGT